MHTKSKSRLAVVSPFLDKSHGTERLMVEWISELAGAFEIHIYSQHIEDLDLSGITWHRIPKLPGPHLLNFLWWFVANRLWREWNQRMGGLRLDLVFSPGVNCLDADAVSVHIVFAEYMRKIERVSNLAKSRGWSALRTLHRKLYYRLVIFLERSAYTNSQVTLIAHSRKTAGELETHYGRGKCVRLVYPGIDQCTFSPRKRAALRDEARRELNLKENQFVILLVGNDWRNKGVPVLLEVLDRLRRLPLVLLIVDRENPSALRKVVFERNLADRVRLLPPRKDVEFYYAAADVYAGPSVQDSYALPPAEAMGCGLPVIVSASAGVSEIITNGRDGLILEDPKDSAALAAMVRRLYEDEQFRNALGEKAAETARKYTWERNGQELIAILGGILQRKAGFTQQVQAQEL